MSIVISFIFTQQTEKSYKLGYFEIHYINSDDSVYIIEVEETKNVWLPKSQLKYILPIQWFTADSGRADAEIPEWLALKLIEKYNMTKIR